MEGVELARRTGEDARRPSTDRLVAEFGQVFPEKFSAVEDSASAHVEEIYRQHSVFEVVSEDVGVVAFDGGDALLFLQAARRLRSGRDTWRRARTPATRRLRPCARAGISTSPSGFLRGIASRRARLPDKSPAWSGLRRRGQGSVRYRTAGRGADGSGSGPHCRRGPGKWRWIRSTMRYARLAGK